LACKIYRIVTGSLINQDLHADNFLKNNVVGIGWYRVGDISDMTESELGNKCAIYGLSGPYVKSVLLEFRDKIKVGDIVIAYKSKNNVVAIGRVAGEYFFDKKYNRDSKWDPKEGLGLPHRRKVVWRRKPSFSRKKLPDDLSSQLKQRGTLKQIYYPINKFEKEIRKIS